MMRIERHQEARWTAPMLHIGLTVGARGREEKGIALGEPLGERRRHLAALVARAFLQLEIALARSEAVLRPLHRIGAGEFCEIALFRWLHARCLRSLLEDYLNDLVGLRAARRGDLDRIADTLADERARER